MGLKTSRCYNSRGNCKDDLGLTGDAFDDYTTAMKLNPESYIARYNLATSYLKKKDYSNAILFYSEALKINPDYSLAYYWRGHTYNTVGDYESAIKDMNEALARNPKDAGIYVTLGDTYFNQKLYLKAIQTYEKIMTFDKNCGTCYYGRARARQDSGMLKEALADYMIFREREPQNANAHNGVGIAYDQMGDTVKAIQNYSKAIQLDTMCYYAYWNRGLIYVAQQKYNEALEDYEKAARRDIGDAKFYDDYGLCLYYTGFKEQALVNFNRSLELNDNRLITLYHRAFIYQELQREPDAVNDYKTIVGLDSTYSDAWAELGRIRLNHGEYADCAAAYDRAISSWSSCANCYFGRAYANQELGFYNKALEDYETYLRLVPDYPGAYNNMGSVYLALKDTAKALSNYNKAIELNSNDLTTYTNRAIIYRGKGNYKAAEEDYFSAIRIDSSEASTYAYLGMNYSNQKNYRKAIYWCEKAVSISPRDPVLYYNLATVKRDSNSNYQVKNDLEKLRVLLQDDPDRYKTLGMLYSQLKDHKNALQNYDSAIALNKADASLYSDRATVWVDLKNNQAALKDLNSAIALDTTYAGYFNERGLIYSLLKDYKNAIKDLNTSIRMNPGNSYTNNNLANCHFALGQKDKACEYWNKALEMGYRYDPAWKKQFGIDDPEELVKKHCAAQSR